ncbi:hypothetical protein [Flavobacterium crassostreae]|uniref:hypothetical protein n=1 Tax=Flavobacterium crassostreae TaxID=1763534 RepID=UPI0012FDF0C9|nr:hypothetical protein [Flavobacterium crassostreae]
MKFEPNTLTDFDSLFEFYGLGVAYQKTNSRNIGCGFDFLGGITLSLFQIKTEY